MNESFEELHLGSIDDYARKMNEVIISKQDGEKEIVSEIDIVKACTYLDNMALRSRGDMLLYCASLNLCNTYVKQPDSKIGYLFKNELGFLLAIAINTDIEGVFFDIQEDKGSLLVVQIANIQFSFHNVSRYKLGKITRKPSLLKSIEWDGVRKQKCANTVFYLAEANPFEITGKTFRGKSLADKVERTVETYLDGKRSFSDIVKFSR